MSFAKLRFISSIFSLALANLDHSQFLSSSWMRYFVIKYVGELLDGVSGHDPS
jgi:hypothetical protein